MTDITQTTMEASLGPDARQNLATAKLIRSALGIKSDDKRFDPYLTCNDAADSTSSDGKNVAVFSIHFKSESMITSLYATAGKHSKQGTLTKEYIDNIACVTNTRGTCIAINLEEETYRIVTRGFPHTPSITVDENVDFNNSTLDFTDFHGVNHVVDMAHTKFYPRYDGCVLRISYNNGATIATTNKRLNIGGSHWGESDTFFTMWKKFGGPTSAELFPDGNDSNVTYFFMLVDPDLQVSSLYPIGEGFIMYLGAATNNGSGTPPPPPCYNNFVPTNDGFSIDTSGNLSIRLDTIMPCTGEGGTHPVGTIFTSTPLDPMVAVEVLKRGYSREPNNYLDVEDPRLSGGESLVAYTRDKVTGENKILGISSIAGNWRRALVNNASNMTSRFYSYLNHALYDKNHSNSRVQITPTTPEGSPLIEVFNGREGNLYSSEQLFIDIASPPDKWFNKLQSKVKEMLEQPSGDLIDLHSNVMDHIRSKVNKCSQKYPYATKTPMNRFSNFAISFFLGLPASYIQDTIGYFPDYINNRMDVHRKITSDIYMFKRMCDEHTLPSYNKGFNRDGENSPQADTLTRIVKQAFKHASNAPKAKTVTDRKGKTFTLTFEQMVKDNVRNLISKESGKTFYHLAQVFRTIEVEQASRVNKRSNKKTRKPSKPYRHIEKDFPDLSGMSASAQMVSPNKPQSFLSSTISGSVPVKDDTLDFNFMAHH